MFEVLLEKVLSSTYQFQSINRDIHLSVRLVRGQMARLTAATCALILTLGNWELQVIMDSLLVTKAFVDSGNGVNTACVMRMNTTVKPQMRYCDHKSVFCYQGTGG